MAGPKFRMIPTVVICSKKWEVQRKYWWGWGFETYCDSKDEAKRVLEHLGQEPLYYGAK